jgi:hypothetical protein
MRLLHLFIVPLASARVIRMQQQTPILEEVGHVGTASEQSSAQKTTEEIAPAIGVHFTTSYAIAAARYQNGTTRDLGRVAGDAAYIDLMSRWTMWQKGLNTGYLDW